MNLDKEIQKIAPETHIEFMDWVDNKLPTDITTEFYDRVYNEFPNLPIELTIGYYMMFLQENNINVSDIFNRATILNAFLKLEKK